MNIRSCIYWTFRPLIKVILRYITHLCELQRICYNTLPGAKRTLGIEFSLRHSKKPAIRTIVKYLDDLSNERRFDGHIKKYALNQSVYQIAICKNINPNVHVKFIKSLDRSIELIWCYNQLVNEISALTRIQYDASIAEHEKKLIKLWCLLKPNVPLEGRVSKQWQEIGFQGDDPKTDFRGMGILGLDNLLFLAQEYPKIAKNILSHTLHPSLGYEFAIVGINLTYMAYNLFLDGTVKTHIFNVSHDLPTINIFHNFYCYLYHEFDKYWIKSKPDSIMDFIFIKQQFEFGIRQKLEKLEAVLKIEAPLEI